MSDAADPSSYQPFLDELTAHASTDDKKAALVDSRAEYQRLTGEVFEDDKQFEMRMASFLDWYLFDRPNPATDKTPAQEFYAAAVREGPPERAAAFRAFTETVHALFEVRKLGKGLVRLRELFSGKDYDVSERRQLAGLEKGDLIEARLIPFGGTYVFSAAFCCHPKGAFKAILKEMKRRKKKEPDRPSRELVYECAKRSLKADRYRQIAVEKIYDFENRKL
ncbi:MAG: hypothetical protein ACOZIN_09405 [Myxococcota bacterium]